MSSSPGFEYDHLKSLEVSPLQRRLGGHPALVFFIFAAAIALTVLLLYSPKYFLGVLFISVILGMTLVSPYAGILVTVAFLFLRPAERIPELGALHFVRIQEMLLICVWLLQRHLRRKKGFVRNPVLKVFAAGAVVIAASFTAAIWKPPVVSFLLFYLDALLILIITVDLMNSESRLRNYLAVLLGAATFLSINQLFFTDRTADAMGVVRLSSIGTSLTDNNDFGLAMLFFLPFAFYLFLASQKLIVRLGLLGMCVIFSASVFASGSRGAIVGFIVMCTAIWFKAQNRVFAGIGLLLLLLTLWTFAPPTYKDYVYTIGNYQQDTTATIRRKAWEVGVQLFLTRPLTGIGATNYSAGYATVKGGSWRTAHSLYYQALTELGLLGIAWLVALVVVIIAATRRAQKRFLAAGYARSLPAATANAIQVSLITFMTAGAFLSALYFPYFWLFGALTIVCEQAAKELPEPGQVIPTTSDTFQLQTVGVPSQAN